MTRYGWAVIILAWIAPLVVAFGHTDMALVMYVIAIILLIIGYADLNQKQS